MSVAWFDGKTGAIRTPQRKEPRMAHAQHTPTLTSLEEAITILFCLVDDVYPLLNPTSNSYESLKKLSDSEVITLAFFQQLRRLMRNCEEPRRSQDRMLMHQTLSKGWCHARSRLLLGLIVRVGGRLVEAQALFGAAQSWTASLAYRPRGHHPGHPRPVAPLQKRARFLALCSRTSAPLLPESLFPKPTQPQGALCGARFARLPTCSGPNALWRFGGLPCPGHYPHPGPREGKSFSQGAVCRASHLREERLQDRVGLRFQGGTFGQPRGRDLRLRAGGGSLRRAPHSRLSHHRGLSRCLPGRQGLYGC